jgi:hypothetical protein
MAKAQVGAVPTVATPNGSATVGFVTGRLPKKVVVQPYTDALPTSPSEDVIVLRVKP